MPSTKLTGAVIQNLKPKEDGSREWYWDTAHKGLCLRVGRRDKTWVYYYRFDGRQFNHRLGKYAPNRTDHMDREAAVNAAGEIDQQLEQGINPKESERPVKPKPSAENPNAFHRRVEQFLDWYENSPKKRGGEKRSETTVDQAKRLLSDEGKHYYLSPLAHSDVATIRRKDVIRLLGGMTDKPVLANRVQAYLEIFFNWCWDREYCDPSPVAGLKKQYAERPRDQVLTEHEIRSLWAGCLKLGYPWGDVIRFTLATGQRPGECRRLSRKDIHNNVWLVEGGSPKNRERHRIPLPSIAREIVSEAPRFRDPYVFTTTSGKRPIGQGGKPYAMLKEAAGFDDWQPRDLRRTFFTFMSEELDFDNQIIGAITNQVTVSKPGVAGVYNKSSWMRQKAEALEAWNDYLIRLVDGGEVVELKASA